ncbi:AsnC family transcriptional regulator [Cellulomonas bogoriensis 69B4 = DSM 16987]|uniref:AsnC family transcriptional regulator n=1 Tax=Cellulomonas bogoriensis 69B4 = DSM 16987 TaxID=1386082 RepID=A0A0A0C3M1_9CELL|nr:AsnC family transcriptional regulator [Cellulomonas bogoriensis 69B4 = DSM 16987]
MLQEDARRSNRELAGLLHVAESTCLERTRGLLRCGVVTGVHAHVDLKKLNRSVQAMVAVRLRPPDRAVIESFHSFVVGLEETIEVFVTAGTDDFLIHVAVRDNDHLNDFILDRLTQRREIVDVRTSVVFRHDRKVAVNLLA